MPEEMRKRTRIEYSDRVLCYKHIITSSNVKPDPAPIRIEINDISYSGLGIGCNRDLSIGDFLLFNLSNNGITKEFMMEVRWCKYTNGSYVAGLRFTSLTKDMLIFIDGLIKAHLNRQTRNRTGRSM